MPLGNVQVQFVKQETDVFCIVTLCGLEWGGRKGMIAEVKDILWSKGLLTQRIINNTCHLLLCFFSVGLRVLCRQQLISHWPLCLWFVIGLWKLWFSGTVNPVLSFLALDQNLTTAWYKTRQSSVKSLFYLKNVFKNEARWTLHWKMLRCIRNCLTADS